MADMGAVERAAGSGAIPQPEITQEPAPEQGGGLEMLAEGMQAISAFIDTQAQQGNPGAEPAMATFTQLVEDMKMMAGGEAQAPEAAGPVPLEPDQTVV